MDYMAAFQISAAGMGYEKTRLEVAALNLANMNVAAPTGTTGYRPLRAVAQPLGVDFARFLSAPQDAGSVPVARAVSVLTTDAAPRLASEPGHPYADERGLVRYPGVDHAAEMIIAMTALRAYEANVAAVGFARSMATRALEIGTQR